MPSQNYAVVNNTFNMDPETTYVPIDNSTEDTIEDLVLDEPDLNHSPELSANLSKKERFASQLVGELPRCPECAMLLKKRIPARCEYCGFSFGYLKKLFPLDQLPPLETLLDFSNKLESDEKKRILKAISFIQRRYPQIIPKVCLLPLQPNVQVHQMALWMINQCPLPEGEEKQDKEWYALLLIDTSNTRCCLAYGYQAEIFIPDESSFKLISTLNRSLKKDRIGDPIVELLNDIVPLLDSTKKMLKRKYKRFKRKN